MCTAINQTQGYHLFGRTLDVANHRSEQIVITPPPYPLKHPYMPPCPRHTSIMGVAYVCDGFPLYYDAINPYGLCMAALHFPHLAQYHLPIHGKQGIPSFALIPYLLSQCHSTASALQVLQSCQITPHAFSPAFPCTPLHWLLSDAQESYVIESTQTGLHIHPNPYHALTNAPTFPEQIQHLSQEPVTIPPDMSSTARLSRAVFANSRALPEHSPDLAVRRFFHVMDTVSQPKGCHISPQGEPIYTVYTSCGDPRQMAYYVTTYERRSIQKCQAPATHAQAHDLICFDFA